ncbi:MULTISPECIES: LysR family transcriptional regulator [unclassified Acidovorax]|uniref:LysR family transcriptional regulator n=1 Tax=unclassified Acidovorax TaxID=2684926 RepID=UPI001C46E8F8|nr:MULTISPECIES: LysR family transcriptional regulator [unclassified Acidovorax]MBV7427978.1 LysR family transcriptional regulator [Acidovorax sp. sif0732]MBV7449235.1 LysR family transcriptional regulator [Acidovorax sp. sif0715]
MTDAAISPLARRITHRHIEVFRAVMAAGSATGAASLLHSSQPTVSRELARLESLLGYALFERVQGRLRANARALALWDEVQRSWQGLERVVDRAVALGRPDAVQLSVLCLPALAHALLPGAAARLLQAHPHARLSVTPQESPLLEEWMSAQRFDLGLCEQAAAPPGTRAEVLLTLDEVAVVPADHLLARRPVLHLEDFADQPFVSLSADDPYRRLIDARFAQAAVPRTLRMETHSAAAVCAMVEHGLGLAIVNPLTALAAAGSGGRLVVRRLAFSIPFSVACVLPLYRPPLPEVAPMLEALQAEAVDVARQFRALP